MTLMWKLVECPRCYNVDVRLMHHSTNCGICDKGGIRQSKMHIKEWIM